MRIFSALCLLLTSLSSYARGGDLSGGGDAIVCSGLLLSNKRVYLADYFDAAQLLAISPRFSSFSFLHRAESEKIVYGALEHYSPGFGKKLKQIRSTLRWQGVDKLEELDGDNIASLPKNLFSEIGVCGKKQLAIQNSATGEIRVNLSLQSKLSPFEVVLFTYHEALIRYQYLLNSKSDSRAARLTLRQALVKGQASKLISKSTKDSIDAFEVLIWATTCLIGECSFRPTSYSTFGNFHDDFILPYKAGGLSEFYLISNFKAILLTKGFCTTQDLSNDSRLKAHYKSMLMQFKGEAEIFPNYLLYKFTLLREYVVPAWCRGR